MSYGVYYVLFLVCFSILVILLADSARNRAERRDGYFKRDSTHNDDHRTAA